MTTIPIAIVGRAQTLEREFKNKSKELILVNKAKKIKSNNFMWSNREKYNIAEY